VNGRQTWRDEAGSDNGRAGLDSILGGGLTGRRVVAAGFQAHLATPIDPAALIARLHRLARGADVS